MTTKIARFGDLCVIVSYKYRKKSIKYVPACASRLLTMATNRQSRLVLCMHMEYMLYSALVIQ